MKASLDSLTRSASREAKPPRRMPAWLVPAAILTGFALLFLALAPLVNEAARAWALTPAFAPSSMYDPTALLLNWTVLGSSYRLTNLLPMLLIGFLLARWQLGNRSRTAWAFAATEPAPARVSWARVRPAARVCPASAVRLVRACLASAAGRAAWA
jgi:hypothetical protein